VVGVADAKFSDLTTEQKISVPPGWHAVTPSILAEGLDKLPPQLQLWKLNYDPQMPTPNFACVPPFTADGREYIAFFHPMAEFELSDTTLNSWLQSLQANHPNRQNFRGSIQKEYGRRIMQIESVQAVNEDGKSELIYVLEQYIPTDGKMLMVQVRYRAAMADTMMHCFRYALSDPQLSPPKLTGNKLTSYKLIAYFALGLLVVAALFPAFYLLRNRRSDGDEL
jgi:hypothetical protein